MAAEHNLFVALQDNLIANLHYQIPGFGWDSWVGYDNLLVYNFHPGLDKTSSSGDFAAGPTAAWRDIYINNFIPVNLTRQEYEYILILK